MAERKRIVTVMLDSECYQTKPDTRETAYITGRLKRDSPTTMLVQDFAQAVADGRTFCCGCFERDPSKTFGRSRFMGQQLFTLDFDNMTEVLGDDGKPLKDSTGHVVKRSLMPHEDGYLDPWMALSRFREKFGHMPMMLYPSMSFSFGGTAADRFDPETKMKYRLVMDAGRLIADAAQAGRYIRKLLQLFPEADVACAKPSRLFFGAQGKAVLYGDEGAWYFHG